MNYEEFFTNRSTSEISKDLLGRTLSFNNGNELLSGTIVEAEAYVGVKDRAAHSVADAVRQMKAYIVLVAVCISILRDNTSSLMLRAKQKVNHKEF